MTDKKQRAPKKMTVEAILKQFDLQTLQAKLEILEHVEQGIANEKKSLEEQIKLIGNKA